MLLSATGELAASANEHVPPLKVRRTMPIRTPGSATYTGPPVPVRFAVARLAMNDHRLPYPYSGAEVHPADSVPLVLSKNAASTCPEEKLLMYRIVSFGLSQIPPKPEPDPSPE